MLVTEKEKEKREPNSDIRSWSACLAFIVWLTEWKKFTISKYTVKSVQKSKQNIESLAV